MGCKHYVVDGVAAIACGKNLPDACAECQAPGGYLCDWKVGHGKTCDRPLCETHAVQVGKDKHLCPLHSNEWKGHPANKQQKLDL